MLASWLIRLQFTMFPRLQRALQPLCNERRAAANHFLVQIRPVPVPFVSPSRGGATAVTRHIEGSTSPEE